MQIILIILLVITVPIVLLAVIDFIAKLIRKAKTQDNQDSNANEIINEHHQYSDFFEMTKQLKNHDNDKKNP